MKNPKHLIWLSSKMHKFIHSFEPVKPVKKIDPKFEAQISGRADFEAIANKNIVRTRKKRKTYIGLISLSGLMISGCATDQQNAVWNQKPLLSMEFMEPNMACRQLELRHPGRKYVYTVYGYKDGSEKKEYSYFNDPDCHGVQHFAFEVNNEKPTEVTTDELYQGEDVAANEKK